MPCRRPHILVTLLGLLLLVCDRTHVAASIPAALRPLAPWITKAIHRGMESKTFAELARQISGRRLIVHVDALRGECRWDGRTRFVSVSGGFRYVRVELRRAGVATTAATLAHELQHVLEIDAGEVRTSADVVALYRRIGVSVDDSHTAFDTRAAVRAGVDTLHELTGRTVTAWIAGDRIGDGDHVTPRPAHGGSD